MYAWATPTYLLDNLSLDEIFMYYDYGIEFEKWRAQQVIFYLSQAFDSKHKQAPKEGGDTPDREAFHAAYGDKIKRPGGDGR